MADDNDLLEEPDEPDENQSPLLPKVEYSSNSLKNRAKGKKPEGGEPAPSDKKIEKIIEGEVIQRKKPLGKKIAETFSGDNMHDVGDYILFDVIVPGVKDLIFETFTQALQRKFYGSGRAGRISTTAIRAGQTIATTAYSKMSSPMSRAGQPDNTPITRSGHGGQPGVFDEVILADRGQAEQVLDTMLELLSTYGSVNVYELYELVGITGNFAQQKWGWDDLRASRIDRIREGYLLNLPKPKPID